MDAFKLFCVREECGVTGADYVMATGTGSLRDEYSNMAIRSDGVGNLCPF